MIRGLKFTKTKGGPGSGHHGHAGRPGLVGGSMPPGGGGFVSAHTARLARLHETLPKIPDNIGDKSHPIKDLNGSAGMEFYRQDSAWMYRNPKSAWMPMTWLRGDPTFQDQLTMSYGGIYS